MKRSFKKMEHLIDKLILNEDETRFYCICMFDTIIDLADYNELISLSNYLFHLSSSLLDKNNITLTNYLEEKRNNGKI